MNGATATTVIPPFQDAGVVHAGAVHASPALAWHALWTRSHCEQLVHDQLAVKGFNLFLPKIDQWSRRGGVTRLIRVPLFPGYVFLHGAMDKGSYVEVLKARGLVQVLGERWDRLATIPDGEIDAIQRIVGAKVLTLPYPYLREGQRESITQAPRADVGGVLVRTTPNRGRTLVRGA